MPDQAADIAFDMTAIVAEDDQISVYGKHVDHKQRTYYRYTPASNNIDHDDVVAGVYLPIDRGLRYIKAEVVPEPPHLILSLLPPWSKSLTTEPSSLKLPTLLLSRETTTSRRTAWTRASSLLRIRRKLVF